MKTAGTKTLALAATAMGMIATAPAYAQDAGGDIVVTARRVEERLQDVPISITVFNQEQIDNRNIVNTADLATYTPSLSVNSRFGPEKASFVIRGFVQDLATAPSVGVYFADVVGARSGGSTTAGNGVGVGNMFDLQNVQVLKGPQGTLFGRNTTGGAVLLVPRKPTDKLEGYVEGSLGNYDMKRVQAVLNVPLADTFKVRLGVDRQKRDGYLRNHSGIGPNRLADSDYIAARLSVVADLTPDLENYTILSYALSDNNGITPRQIGCNRAQAGVNPLAAAACRQIDRQAARGDGWWDIESNEPDPKLRMETWQVINTTTWQASDTLTIKNIVSYAELRETTRMSLSGDNLLLPNGARLLDLTRLRNTPGYNNSSQSTMTEELQFQGRTENGSLTWQAGIYHERSNPLGYTSQWTPFLLNCTDDYALQCAASASGNISRPHQKSWFRNTGLYAQATYNLTEQLAVTGGLRYTWDKHTHAYNQVGITFPTANTPRFVCTNTWRIRNPDGSFPVIVSGNDFERCTSTFTAKSDKPTWLIDLEYKPTEDVMLYAKWARGYRAGGVASANIFYETWEPEKVDTYEVGAKTSFQGAVKGYFNLTGFYNDFSNQQIQATLQARRDLPTGLVGGSAIVNAGKSRIWGVEADASATFFDSLRFDVGYTYLNTKLKELIAPEVPADSPWERIIPTGLPGGPLGLSPKHRLTLTGTYTLPLDESIGDISFGATYVYTSKQVASRSDDAAFAAGAIGFYPGFPVRNPGVLPSTNLLNLNANWQGVMGAPIDLSFFMTNVTNEKYPLNLANYFNSFSFESQIVNEPRMWGFRLRYRFGE